VVAVQFSRQEVVDILRRAGLPELAEEAKRNLPDPVDSDHVAAWGAQHGITKDALISWMGGSP
jgi:hypothetical protein